MTGLVVTLFAVATKAALAADPDMDRIQTAAKQGVVAQEIELAADYFAGRGVPRDEKLAAHWYEKAAAAGDPAAQNQIGYFYETGIGVPVDARKAVHWYQLAAASGLVRGKVNLGVANVQGIGVPKDEKFAAQLFEEAARNGSGSGATYLGDLYYFGLGVRQDRAEAIKWYEKGVKMHSPLACFQLGILNSDSKDHPHDFPKAAALLRASANAGYVPAMQLLGKVLAQHPEVVESTNEAAFWLDQAASAGSWKASVVLGVLARDGQGLPVDSKSAYFHFKVATLQGGEKVQKLVHNDLRTLTAKLGSEQTAAIDSEANQWFGRHRLALNFIYKDSDRRSLFPAYAQAVSPDGLHPGRLIPTPLIGDEQEESPEREAGKPESADTRLGTGS